LVSSNSRQLDKVELATLDYIGLMNANNQLNSVTEMLVDSEECFFKNPE
jgi:hypothetical protein